MEALHTKEGAAGSPLLLLLLPQAVRWHGDKTPAMERQMRAHLTRMIRVDMEVVWHTHHWPRYLLPTEMRALSGAL